MLNHRERIAGLATCVLLVAIAVWSIPWSSGQAPQGGVTAASQLIDYVSHRTDRFAAQDRSQSLRARDPVFMQRSKDVVQVGYVERIEKLDSVHIAHIRWYHDGASADQYRLLAYRNRGRLEDAIELMFPPEKRQRIERLLATAMKQHGQRIASRIGPILERSLRESLPIIERGVRASIARHRREVDLLARRWNDDIIEERLLPLARQEIVPIVREHGGPVAQEIGRELWERASIWSFTWRALYDKTPLPRKDLMKQEWDRFVEQEAIPVLRQHSEEISLAVQKTMVEISNNPKTRAELSAAADTIARDPQTRALVQTILRESVVDNAELKNLWSDIWNSAEVRAMLDQEGQLLEPTIRQLGDELMGSRDQGIDAAFARLLRNQVLQKDQRWVMAVQVDQPGRPTVIETASDRAVYPLPIFAAEAD
ncbi:MAG: hypothetical protein ACO1RT_03665 [Planctomycetaceae bacterium]